MAIQLVSTPPYFVASHSHGVHLDRSSEKIAFIATKRDDISTKVELQFIRVPAPNVRANKMVDSQIANILSEQPFAGFINKM